MTAPVPAAGTPLGVYVHWPYCARICPYCDFNVVRARGREEEAAKLAHAILDDLRTQRALTGPRRVVSIFFGGGTPSLMEPAWVRFIVQTVRELWDVAPDLEVSLEANPTDAEAQRFAGLADAGVNRLSLGLQSLDDTVLKFLGRNHRAAEGRWAAALATQLFPRVSLDLIYARPSQTPESWAAELEAAVALGAEHISPYQLTIEPKTAFFHAVERGEFRTPDPDLAAELYETTQTVLGAAGFQAYEVSNHARGDAAQARHNLVYWRGWDYVGVGPGAHGRITVDGVRRATYAAAAPADYIRRIERLGVGFASDEALTPREAAEERLLGGLRIPEGVPFAELTALELDAKTVRPLVELGLVAADPNRLRATAAGRRVLDRLTAELAG